MNDEIIFQSLKQTLDSYHPISQDTWDKFKKFCKIKTYKKNELAFDMYSDVNCITYIYKGLFRAYSINENGEEFNKNFFWETRFFGPMKALLKKDIPITSSVQAIEEAIVVDINFKEFRKLLFESQDLMIFQILYLEKHWIFDKDDNTYSLILEDAKERYERFLKTFDHILPRLSQLNIALYLGISPTHLSRIKKS